MSEDIDASWAIAVYSQEDSSDEQSIMVQSAGELDVVGVATAILSVLHLEYGMTKDEVLECFDAISEGDVNELH